MRRAAITGVGVRGPVPTDEGVYRNNSDYVKYSRPAFKGRSTGWYPLLTAGRGKENIIFLYPAGRERVKELPRIPLGASYFNLPVLVEGTAGASRPFKLQWSGLMTGNRTAAVNSEILPEVGLCNIEGFWDLSIAVWRDCLFH